MPRLVHEHVHIRRIVQVHRVAQVEHRDCAVVVEGVVRLRIGKGDGAPEVGARAHGDTAEGGEEVFQGRRVLDVAAEQPGRGAVGVEDVVGFDAG